MKEVRCRYCGFTCYKYGKHGQEHNAGSAENVGMYLLFLLIVMRRISVCFLIGYSARIHRRI